MHSEMESQECKWAELLPPLGAMEAGGSSRTPHSQRYCSRAAEVMCESGIREIISVTKLGCKENAFSSESCSRPLNWKASPLPFSLTDKDRLCELRATFKNYLVQPCHLTDGKPEFRHA
jgi:hypothetical protein